MNTHSSTELTAEVTAVLYSQPPRPCDGHQKYPLGGEYWSISFIVWKIKLADYRFAFEAAGFSCSCAETLPRANHWYIIRFGLVLWDYGLRTGYLLGPLRFSGLRCQKTLTRMKMKMGAYAHFPHIAERVMEHTSSTC